MPFGGIPWNKGKKGLHHPPERVLVKGKKSQAFVLKRALLEIGREYRCEGLREYGTVCSVIDQWNGRLIKLQIDHFNGDGADNRAENLRFLCLNCHSQTPTFGNSRDSQYIAELRKNETICGACEKPTYDCGCFHNRDQISDEKIEQLFGPLKESLVGVAQR